MSLVRDTRKKLTKRYESHENGLDPDHDEDIHIKASKLSPDEFREVLRLGMKHRAEMAPQDNDCPHCGQPMSHTSEDIMDRGEREAYDDEHIYGHDE